MMTTGRFCLKNRMPGKFKKNTRHDFYFFGVFMRNNKEWQHTAGSIGLVGLLLGLLAGVAPGARAELPGVGFSFSRVVLMEEDKGGATVEVRNNSDNLYLVQSQIHAADANKGRPVNESPGDVALPFMVLPPLKRLEPHAELPLRILATPEARERLPRDRESLFFISSKSIPSVPAPSDDEKKSGGRVVLALVNSIKLYYRPAGLKKQAMDEVAASLTFSRTGKELRVHNASAYYITFSSLSVGGAALNSNELQAMVPPKGEQAYLLPARATDSVVRWQLIDEYGLPTDEQSRDVP